MSVNSIRWRCAPRRSAPSLRASPRIRAGATSRKPPVPPRTTPPDQADRARLQADPPKRTGPRSSSTGARLSSCFLECRFSGSIDQAIPVDGISIDYCVAPCSKGFKRCEYFFECTALLFGAINCRMTIEELMSVVTETASDCRRRFRSIVCVLEDCASSIRSFPPLQYRHCWRRPSLLESQCWIDRSPLDAKYRSE